MASTTPGDLEARPCRYCKNEIPPANIQMHELHCKRHLRVCDKCGETVPINYLDEHEEMEHREEPCRLCAVPIAKDKLLKHMEYDCSQRRVLCSYCDLKYPYVDFSEHEQACGARTDECEKCLKTVMLRNMLRHQSSNCKAHVIERSRPTPKPRDSMSYHHFDNQNYGQHNDPFMQNYPDSYRAPSSRYGGLRKVNNMDANISTSAPAQHAHPRPTKREKIQPPASQPTNESATQSKDRKTEVSVGEELELPCEFCEELIPVASLEEHQNTCTAGEGPVLIYRFVRPEVAPTDRRGRDAYSNDYNSQENVTPNSNYYATNSEVSPMPARRVNNEDGTADSQYPPEGYPRRSNANPFDVFFRDFDYPPSANSRGSDYPPSENSRGSDYPPSAYSRGLDYPPSPYSRGSDYPPSAYSRASDYPPSASSRGSDYPPTQYRQRLSDDPPPAYPPESGDDALVPTEFVHPPDCPCGRGQHPPDIDNEEFVECSICEFPIAIRYLADHEYYCQRKKEGGFRGRAPAHPSGRILFFRPIYPLSADGKGPELPFQPMLPASRTQDDSVTSVTSRSSHSSHNDDGLYNNNYGLPSNRTETSMNEPDNTNISENKFPCEFCGNEFTSLEYIDHQDICDENEPRTLVPVRSDNQPRRVADDSVSRGRIRTSERADRRDDDIMREQLPDRSWERQLDSRAYRLDRGLPVFRAQSGPTISSRRVTPNNTNNGEETLPCEFCCEEFPTDQLFHHQDICDENILRTMVPVTSDDQLRRRVTDDSVTRSSERADRDRNKRPTVLNTPVDYNDDGPISGDYKSVERQDKHRTRNRGADSTMNEPDNANDGEETFPCEFCSEEFPADLLMNHQLMCPEYSPQSSAKIPSDDQLMGRDVDDSVSSGRSRTSERADRDDDDVMREQLPGGSRYKRPTVLNTAADYNNDDLVSGGYTSVKRKDKHQDRGADSRDYRLDSGQPSFRTHNDSMTSSSSLDRSVSLPSDRTVTAMNEPDNINDGEETLPCEFCGVKFPLQLLMEHQLMCPEYSPQSSAKIPSDDQLMGRDVDDSVSRGRSRTSERANRDDDNDVMREQLPGGSRYKRATVLNTASDFNDDDPISGGLSSVARRGKRQTRNKGVDSRDYRLDSGLPSSRTQYDSITSRSLLDRTMSLPSNSPVTSMSEPHNTNSGEVKFPCEFCEEVFPASLLLSHQIYCPKYLLRTTTSLPSNVEGRRRVADDYVTAGRTSEHTVKDDDYVVGEQLPGRSRYKSPTVLNTAADYKDDEPISGDYTLVERQDKHRERNRGVDSKDYRLDSGLPSSGTQYDSITSSSSLDTLMSLPSNRTVTSMNEPHSTNNGEETLPCEFCEEEFPADMLYRHQYACPLNSTKTTVSDDQLMGRVTGDSVSRGRSRTPERADKDDDNVVTGQLAGSSRDRGLDRRTYRLHSGLPSSGTQYDSITSSSSLDRTMSLPSNRTVTSMNEPHNTNNGEETLPCEFCEEEFPTDMLYRHQYACPLNSTKTTFSDDQLMGRVTDDSVSRGRSRTPERTDKDDDDVATGQLAGSSRDRGLDRRTYRLHSGLPSSRAQEDSITSSSSLGTLMSLPSNRTVTSMNEPHNTNNGEETLPCEFCEEEFPADMLYRHQNYCPQYLLQTTAASLPSSVEERRCVTNDSVTKGRCRTPERTVRDNDHLMREIRPDNHQSMDWEDERSSPTVDQLSLMSIRDEGLETIDAANSSGFISPSDEVRARGVVSHGFSNQETVWCKHCHMEFNRDLLAAHEHVCAYDDDEAAGCHPGKCTTTVVKTTKTKISNGGKSTTSTRSTSTTVVGGQSSVPPRSRKAVNKTPNRDRGLQGPAAKPRAPKK